MNAFKHSILKSLGAFNHNLIPHFGLHKFNVENASYVKDFEQEKVYLGIYRRIFFLSEIQDPFTLYGL